MSGRRHDDRRDGPKQQLLQTEAMELHGNDSGIFSVKSQERQSHRTSSASVGLWWFEVLGMATSVAALLAIFGILFAYSGKPLSDWKAILRPNTVVAVLSTLSKSAMLMVVGQCIGQLKWVYFAQRPRSLRNIEIFDDASRGPLGSAKLLVHINWTALLASVGAIITLLSLGMDPFIQQVISYDAVTFNDTTAKAYLSTAQAYDTGLGYRTHLTGPDGGLQASSIRMVGLGDPSIAGAIYKGVFGDVFRSTVACSSGNCTWPSYESLGICSSCTNVTAASKTNCTLTLNDYYDPPKASDRQCLTRSPRGVAMESSNDCTTSEWRGTVWNASAMVTDPDAPRGHRLLTKDGTIGVVAGTRFRKVDDREQAFCQSTEESLVEDVIECTLKWCTKSYERTIVENGTLSDPASTTEPLDFIEFETCGGLFDETDAFKNTTWTLREENVYDEIYSDMRPAFRDKDVPQYTCPQGDNEGETEDRAIKTKQASELGAKFQQAPNVFLINDRNTFDIQSAISFIFQGGLTQEFVVGEDSTKLALAAAQQSGEFSQLMDRVAESMTNSIRVAPNGTHVDGMTHRTDIVITVHWHWMALPGAIVLFSIGLLSISMVLSSEKSSRAVWKSSLLAALFHGLQGWTEEELDRVELKDMETRAKGMKASLKPGLSGSMKLVKHQ
ncbi:unnamed protein product [Cercospora beticola]|nr:unnamed protein product [Cercospora beticola]